MLQNIQPSDEELLLSAVPEEENGIQDSDVITVEPLKQVEEMSNDVQEVVNEVQHKQLKK